MSAEVVAIVPSLGLSGLAAAALERLRAELASVRSELIWVSPRSAPPPPPLGRDERWLALGAPAGFAAAVNRGIAASAAPLVAVINDDALLAPGWLAPLRAELERDERLAAVQGVVIQLDERGAEPICDGCGVGWNRWWQAIQIGRGAPAPALTAPPFEPFGVQATAALYRRAALERVARAGARPFDERLESWYEDVDLAGRLRAAGFGARTLPAARAQHAGSATGATMPGRRRRLLARNRILVVARLCGRRFPAVLSRLLARDLIDGARAVSKGEALTAAALLAGWCGAIWSAPRFMRWGAPLVAPEELARFPLALPIGSAE